MNAPNSLLARLTSPAYLKKFCIMAAAIVCMGISVSFLIETGWGTDPGSFMNLNISRCIGWTFGTWQLTFNIMLLIVTIIFGRNLIGPGTLVNMTLIGYTADFCGWLWRLSGLHVFLTETQPFASKTAIFCAATAAFVLSAAVYMNTDMGLAPYDAAAKIISGAIPRVPFFIIRICYDALIVSTGVVFGTISPAGRQGSMLGSIVMALTLGPAISLVGRRMKPRQRK